MKSCMIGADIRLSKQEFARKQDCCKEFGMKNENFGFSWFKYLSRNLRRDLRTFKNSQ